jgi:hypothetical protein
MSFPHSRRDMWTTYNFRCWLGRVYWRLYPMAVRQHCNTHRDGHRLPVDV